MGIRDRLRTRGVNVAPVEDIEDGTTEEAVVPAKAPPKSTSKPKAPVAPVVEDEDELEDEAPVVAPPKRGAKAPVVAAPVEEDDLEDEAPVVAPPKRGPKAKAPVVAVAVVEDDDGGDEDDLEDEAPVVAPPKRGPKAKAPTATSPEKEKIVKPSSKPSFIQTKAVVEKVYEADTWLPRDEYLNRLMPAFADTAFAGITKTQLKEFLEVFEAATVGILQTNDIYIFGIKSRTVVTPPRIYAPRDSGLPHVRTEYHTEINAHRDVTIKLSFDKETRRGTVNTAGAFVEGKFDGKKFTPGTWHDKDTFIPKKK